jgi:hypothetical protein
MSDQPGSTTAVDWIIQCRGLPDGPHSRTWRHDGGPGSGTRDSAEEIAALYRERLTGHEYRVAKRTTTTVIQACEETR